MNEGCSPSVVDGGAFGFGFLSGLLAITGSQGSQINNPASVSKRKRAFSSVDYRPGVTKGGGEMEVQVRPHRLIPRPRTTHPNWEGRPTWHNAPIRTQEQRVGRGAHSSEDQRGPARVTIYWGRCCKGRDWPVHRRTRSRCEQRTRSDKLW